MAIVGTQDYESGVLPTPNSGTVSIVSSPVHTGSFALRSNPTTTGAGWAQSFLFTGIATAWYLVFFRYATKPASNDEDIFWATDNAQHRKLGIAINSSGNLLAYDRNRVLLATGTTVLSANTWYGIGAKCGTGVTAAFEIRIDNIFEMSGTGDLFTANAASCLCGKVLNANGNTVDFFYDDVFADDADFPGALSNSPSDNMLNLSESLVEQTDPAISIFDNANNLAESLTTQEDGFVTLADDLNNWAESVGLDLPISTILADDLNLWNDQVTFNVAAAQNVVLADDLNNWLDVVSINLAESPCLPITSYSHITFAQMKTLLANRLSDPNKVFWIDDELGLYIQEAIRTWAQLSGFYSKRCTFDTVAGQFYYDLPTVLGGATDMGYTVTDQQLVKLIQYHFLEPATGSTWSTGTGQTDQFALIDVTNALEKRRNDFLLKTGCVVTSSTITPTALVGRVKLADSTIDVRRVDWRTSGPQSAYSLVRRRDEWSANSFNVGWQSGSSNPPKSYSLAVTPPIQLQFQPPCSTTPLSIGLLTINSGPALNPAIGVLMSVPDNLSPYVKWGAMADMLGKDGQARDPARSKYCQQRYEEGVEITKALASLEQAQINQSNLWIRAVLDLDNFVAGWQNQTGQPTKVGMAGWNLLALAKVPDSIYTVTVDFIPNAPVPTLDADLVQIGRGNLDIILDYAEHLAAFKMAGTEFEATIGHYERMMDSALNNNARLRAIANNLKALRQHPEREEKVNPRKEEEAA